MKARYEVIKKQKDPYRKSSKKEKGRILDHVCESTGLSRDRAKKLLGRNKARSPNNSFAKRRGRKPKYGKIVAEALARVWEYMDFAGGKRLCAGMDDIPGALFRFGEVRFDNETTVLPREMSPATADRLLARKKRKRGKGMPATKPGTLLKANIPLRLGTQWDDAVPGFMEADLVAHCGTTTAGEYINTLDMTDISTGWTETQAVLNKARKRVFAALKDIRQRLPFPLRGIDSDNGGEFINAELFRYCQKNDICFTRSRPYMKNDNWHVARRRTGMWRAGTSVTDGMKALRRLTCSTAITRCSGFTQTSSCRGRS
jgi:hypothetical protein